MSRQTMEAREKIAPALPADKLNYPRLFLLLGAFFGLAMLLLTPPFQVPDEHDHFFRTMMIAAGRFTTAAYPFSEAEKKQIPPKYLQGRGGIVPLSVPYTARLVNRNLPFHPENKQDPGDLRKMLALPLRLPGQPEVFINTSAAGYAPLLYLPGALSLAVGSRFSLSPLWLMYLGRLSNLLVYLGLVYWALTIVPTGKIIFFLLGLMPMSLFLAPSLSIDGITIAAALLLTAVLLELAAQETPAVKTRTWFIAPVALTLLALGKPVYCPLLLLLFLSPRAWFVQDRGRLYLFFASLGLAGAAWLVWRLLQESSAPPELGRIPFDYTSFQMKDQLLPLLDQHRQLRFLQDYPWTVFTILSRTLQTQGRFCLESFVGLLGWLDTGLPGWIYVSYPPALLAGALSCRPLGKRLWFEKILLAIIWALISGAILLAFYLLATPVGNAIIGGLQGRYFIPAAPPFLLLFGNSFVLKKNRYLGSAAFIGWPGFYVGIVLLTTIYSLWNRYY
ncbi:MAG: DUF2142 domain-containing protein [Deltaproteobacteria bacterium]|nr:DUF2142 domain-containing protein [Deltaproteobacteria bacterium]